MGEYLLEVQDLKTYFKVKAGRVRAVDGVTFGVKPGEKVVVGGGITITVVEVKGSRVRIGIDAPAQVAIVRAELSCAPTLCSATSEPVTAPSS